MVKEVSTETSLLDVMENEYEDNITSTKNKNIIYEGK
jgi:hypothetical protein